MVRVGALAVTYTKAFPAGTGKQWDVAVEGAMGLAESKHQCHVLLCDLEMLPNFA